MSGKSCRLLITLAVLILHFTLSFTQIEYNYSLVSTNFPDYIHSRHESTCCLPKSHKAEYIFLLNAMPNSILEFNCLSFMQLTQCKKHCIIHCLPWSLYLLSPQYYFYFQFHHFKRNAYTSLVYFWVGSHKSKCKHWLSAVWIINLRKAYKPSAFIRDRKIA